MSDEPENLTLRLRRRMDRKFDRVIGDVHDLKVRMSPLAEGLVGVHRRIDRLDLRAEPIERRLDLVDVAY